MLELRRRSMAAYFGGGAVVGLLSLPLGLPLFLQLLLTSATGLGLAYLVRCRLDALQYGEISTELLPLVFLWLIFGFGGVLLLLNVNTLASLRLGNDPYTVPLFASWVTLGGGALMANFRLVRRYGPSLHPNSDPTRGSVPVTLLLLAFDWFVRLTKIRRGVYFGWVAHAGFDSEVWANNTLFQVHGAFAFVTLALLAFQAARADSLAPRIFHLLLHGQLLLLFLEGSRLNILLSVLVAVMVWMAVRRIQPRLRHMVLTLLGFLFFFGVFAPVFRAARYQMRADALELVKSPATIPARFLFEYMPEAASLDVILGTDVRQEQSTAGRVGSYAAYATSILGARDDGISLLSFDQFLRSLTLVVPRALLPSKEPIDADAIVQRHYLFGTPGRDTPGTPISDISAYFGAGGVIALLFLAGGLFGLLSRTLPEKWGVLGEVILIGLAPSLLPVGDAFAAYLARFRNGILAIICVALGLALVRGYQEIAGRHNQRPRRSRATGATLP